MRPHLVAGSAFAGALLGLLAALANGTPLLAGLAGGLLVGEDDGGVAEEVASAEETPLLTPLPTHG